MEGRLISIMKPCSHHRPPGDKQLGPESPNVHVFTQPPAILLYFFFLQVQETYLLFLFQVISGILFFQIKQRKKK